MTTPAVDPRLRPVAGVAEIQVVGALEPLIHELAGISSAAQSVWLHQGVIGHISQRRECAGAAELEFVLTNLPMAIMRPDFWRRTPKRERNIDLVHVVDKTRRPLLVGVKFVSAAEAASATDEIWVSTAYPLTRSFLTAARWTRTLKRVDRR